MNTTKQRVLLIRVNWYSFVAVLAQPVHDRGARFLGNGRRNRARIEQVAHLRLTPCDPVRGLWLRRPVFRYLLVDRYWPAQPRFQWDPEKKEARELIVLPNRKPMDDATRAIYFGQVATQVRDQLGGSHRVQWTVPGSSVRADPEKGR